jgi:hypothetical protein
MGLTIYAPGLDPQLPEYSFYGGTERLRFEQKSWTYFRRMPDGSLDPQSGVTGVCKLCTPVQPLMNWAVKTALARAKKLLIERGYVTGDPYEQANLKPLFEAELDKILAEAKEANVEELEAAGDTGSAAHDWIERYIKATLSGNIERRLELLSKLPEDERAANADIAALCWMVEHRVRWVSTEEKCFSRMYGYAGTLDGIAYVSSCDDPICCPHPFESRLSLIDHKTSNALRLQYLYQTAAYMQAKQEESGIKIEDRWVLRYGKDDRAEYDPWHQEGDELFQEDLQGYLCAQALSKAMHTTEDRLQAAGAYKRAERKKVTKALKDAENAICCPEASEYKGKRLKKGCNGTEKMCQACEAKYAARGKVQSVDDTPKTSEH